MRKKIIGIKERVIFMENEANLIDLINDIEADLKICHDHFESSYGENDEFFKFQQTNLIRIKTITEILSEIIEKIK